MNKVNREVRPRQTVGIAPLSESGGIAVSNLSKSYGKVQALSDVTLSVDKGELFGLIGPDGAGKTTLSSASSPRSCCPMPERPRSRERTW